SLETYALEITHIIKTSLSHIKQRAEFNIKHFHEQQYQGIMEKYNKDIMKEIDKLVIAIDFMSKYTRSEKNWEEFNTKNIIFNVFESYAPILEREKIKYIIEIQDNIILNYNIVLFQDIITNLLNNSIKAMKDIEDRTIKVSAFTEGDELNILFSDNGTGIKKEDKERIFEIYHTTTAEDGGNGMGLYMVKTNLTAIKATIKVVDSEINNGATFKLEIPFKR
ncbi:MAG: HAMP domain-containing sensor histidine kinase, partial [Sulfurospirillaceae bacterium]|nr:HAMP domain-containing sensor histidine kinase [Sulfurospirillaceae bacterium]